jgi:hypothetical protein
MKADGIEYDERMDLLEEVTWPRPLEELLEHTYAVYQQRHPWIAEAPLSPKSVVRDLYERAMTFGEYVAFYGLSRSEGLVLRYLTDAYRALRQTVPDSVKTDDLDDLVEWLGEVVRQTDSSLLDEWEQLTDPDRPLESLESLAEQEVAPPRPRALTANARSFRVLVRNAMFRRVELAALRRWDLLGELDAEAGWSAEAWRTALDPYFAEHADIGTGPDARGPALLLVEAESGRWAVQQILDDPDGDHDWRITAEVDLAASDEEGELVLSVTGFGPLSGLG